MDELRIRRVQAADLPALLDIYNHYVLNTPITFDIEPRTLVQRREWFELFGTTGRYQCFVAEKDGIAVGWACSTRFKDREAYTTSVETSVYCAPDHVGHGLGRQLYATLFEALAEEDIHRAYGGITLPNEASVGLHIAMGFKHIGTQSEVGRKFGQFWDVALFQRRL
ncbi:MAG: N-acetyltransferase [Alphaproteobacteria bacterium]|nr:N-acetyltransferase [Alphaproteobacteria bacterium]